MSFNFRVFITPLDPPSLESFMGTFYGDAHIPVKHRVFDRILRRSSGFEVNID